ncbi:DUF6445 family protein [Pseudoalteromonas tunicata]|uniref:Prolyl 4-hydroxylase alpha subunit Fe(2+) 2OG dioxygenase domain-containing protein n=1 Tax=Pseudoalteromonas tunicata D2 TaxID=87626 RepID=A4CBD6_9GAMM|nr:DUF6445 family protein [Pseudoalteromonas tunicata]ATC94229.1 hypothetical protein PTUN_a1622 [Pseudoalteromonas tunicata]AXT29984.1 hypothetical protein D1819_03670 [Pseudoalteromonas tunicata]EAR27673.1 hypothetical protein PTD2_17665 [Pseudoalteromonas tunicata D2]
MFYLNNDFTVKKITIPSSNHILFIIDDFLKNPEVLVNFAKNTAYFNPPGADGTFYPGKRDKMPAPYKRALSELLHTLTTQGYSDKFLDVDVYRSEISITTLKENELSIYQKLPHVDCYENNEFATVHYLCSEQHGGTSFYKYKSTGETEINGDNAVIDMIKSLKEFENEHSGYLQGSTRLFEQVFTVKPKFNRIIIYSGNILHCADLKGEINQTSDLSLGRLTVASFFCIKK